MGKHKIEVFTADCPLCRETLDNVEKAVAERDCGCEIVNNICQGDECCEPAKNYDIKAVPTIVIDGKISLVGKHSVSEIQAEL